MARRLQYPVVYSNKFFYSASFRFETDHALSSFLNTIYLKVIFQNGGHCFLVFLLVCFCFCCLPLEQNLFCENFRGPVKNHIENILGEVA